MVTNTTLHIIQIVLISIFIPILIFFGYTHRDAVKHFFISDISMMHIGDIVMRVEIVESDTDRVQGLSYRESFTEADGMLFIFPESGYHSFWMKDMLFSIDIIWIDENLKVIAIDKNIQPDTYPKAFVPPRPAKYVVETNIHFSDTFSLKKGDTVQLPLSYR
jgi:uncharacterized membrane protein (UPF0127 family)